MAEVYTNHEDGANCQYKHNEEDISADGNADDCSYRQRLQEQQQQQPRLRVVLLLCDCSSIAWLDEPNYTA